MNYSSLHKKLFLLSLNTFQFIISSSANDIPETGKFFYAELMQSDSGQLYTYLGVTNKDFVGK